MNSQTKNGQRSVTLTGAEKRAIEAGADVVGELLFQLCDAPQGELKTTLATLVKIRDGNWPLVNMPKTRKESVDGADPPPPTSNIKVAPIDSFRALCESAEDWQQIVDAKEQLGEISDEEFQIVQAAEGAAAKRLKKGKEQKNLG